MNLRILIRIPTSDVCYGLRACSQPKTVEAAPRAASREDLRDSSQSVTAIGGRRIHLPRARRDPRGLLRVLMRIGPGEIQDRRAWSRPSSAKCEEPRIDAALPVPGSPAYLQPEAD